MKKETIEKALYSAVFLTDIWGEDYRGWLVPKDGCYAILGNNIWIINQFKASHIKSITYMTNGKILK